MRLPNLPSLLLVILLLPSCKSGEKKESTAGELAPVPSAPAQVSDAAPPKAAPVPHFKIDGNKLAGVSLADDVELLSLAALPPIADWKTIIVRSDDGREFRGAKPQLLTGQRTMKLVKQAGGDYEFRVMEPGDAGEVIRHKMTRVDLVHVHTQSYTPPPPPQPKSSLLIKQAGKQKELTPEIFKTRTKTPEPGEAEPRDTWNLLDLVGGSPSEVLLRSVSGEELRLSGDELADKNQLHLIKRNRRGEFHYRGWTLGPTPVRKSELRSIIEMELP